MNVYDLMIGDLVQFDEDTCVIDELRVDGTAVLVAMNTDLTSVDGDQVDVEELYPIPLTEDILVKNGFGQKGNLTYVYGQVEIIKHRDNWNVVINKYCVFVDMNIKFVHQLQHLLRLCGIEKEVQL